MKTTRQIVLCSVFGLIFLLARGISAFGGEILLFAGAGLRQPTDRLIERFEEKTGHKVYVEYGGGGKLAVRIRASGRGDLFMPGALFYIENLQKSGHAKDYKRVAAHTPVVGVNRKSGKAVKAFADLAKPGVRVALGDPGAMAFGRTSEAILECSGMKKAILDNVTVYAATVKQLALYVSLGDVDAAIIGRADAVQAGGRIRIVEIPEACFRREIIAAARLKNAAGRPEVTALQNYLAGPAAERVFTKFGFLPIDEKKPE